MVFHAIIDPGKSKIKTMQKLSQKLVILRHLRLVPVLVIAVVLLVGSTSVAVVRADQFDSQIQALQNQNDQTQASVDSLQSQATSYQAEINNLQQQIAGIQSAIAVNQAKQAELQQEIIQGQQQLDYQKKVLGEDLKAMYVGGSMTTVEMLATSKNLSNFVDAETYSSAVQNKIQSTMQQISTLQNQLEQQQVQVNQLVAIEQQQNTQLNSEQAQQQQLLAYNQSQQASYNQQIQANQSQIAVLRAEQIAANQKLVGSGKVDFSGSCGGSYPATASGPAGSWGCNYSLDNTIDNWGMYNRECVSYTAWMVYKSYGYMPYWGGNGDANQWPGDARAAGIPVGNTPKVGSVAIYMGGSTDPWGHAMWVRSVNGDGTITVDQYNLYYDGNFYETTIPASGLVYIYFGG
jgi:surface antigen/peptidoglycan hydrolase CwlO-like protein